MKHRLATLLAILAVASVAFPMQANGQGRVRWRGGQGWGSGSQYSRIYDVSTVNTVEGDVVNVELFSPGPGLAPGVHLMLGAGDETITVHLGPAWYIENQEDGIEAGDHVRIEGSRVSVDGEVVLIAAVVTRGNETLVLRDENGVPFWSGWGGGAVRGGRRRP